MSGALLLLDSGAMSITVTASPATITDVVPSGPTLHVFATVTLTVVGGTPSSYTWSFDSQSAGTWTVNSGQSTAAAKAQVTGGGVGAKSANFDCAVVVGGVTYPITIPLEYDNS